MRPDRHQRPDHDQRPAGLRVARIPKRSKILRSSSDRAAAPVSHSRKRYKASAASPDRTIYDAFRIKTQSARFRKWPGTEPARWRSRPLDLAVSGRATGSRRCGCSVLYLGCHLTLRADIALPPPFRLTQGRPNSGNPDQAFSAPIRMIAFATGVDTLAVPVVPRFLRTVCGAAGSPSSWSRPPGFVSKLHGVRQASDIGSLRQNPSELM